MNDQEVISNKPDETATHYVYDVGVYFSTKTGTYFNDSAKKWEITDFYREDDLMQNYSRVLKLN